MDSIANIQNIATTTVASVWSVAGDFLVVLVIFGLLLCFAWYMGRSAFASLLVSFYVGLLLYTIFPYQTLALSFGTTPFFKLLIALGIFLIFTVIPYIVLRRISDSDFFSIGIIGTFVLCVLGTGFLMAVGYEVLPVRDVYTFTPTLDLLFAPKDYFFWWIGAPLLGLLFFAR